MASLTSFGSCSSLFVLSPPKTLPMDRRDDGVASDDGDCSRKEDCWNAETANIDAAAMPMHTGRSSFIVNREGEKMMCTCRLVHRMYLFNNR